MLKCYMIFSKTVEKVQTCASFANFKSSNIFVLGPDLLFSYLIYEHGLLTYAWHYKSNFSKLGHV